MGFRHNSEVILQNKDKYEALTLQEDDCVELAAKNSEAWSPSLQWS